MSFRFPRLKVSPLRLRIARLFTLLVLLLAGGFGQAQAAGITLVQHIGKDAGTTTTSTLAFPGANTAGNFIAVVIRGGLSNSQVFTVQDSNANTYKQAKQIGSSGSQVTSAIYYAENISGGTNTITITMTVSGPLRFAILEYSGVATSNSLDAAVSASTTSTSPNSGNLTTTVNGDLLLGEVATADSVTFTGGAGFTVRDFVPAEPGTKLISEDQMQATAGTASATATLNPSTNWAALLAAFKPAGGVAGSPASIAASAGTPQSAPVGTAFATQLQATVKDSFNNPVSGATVTFTAPGSGASGNFAGGVTTATTNASGVATAAVFTANTTAGAYTVTASVSGVSTPANFSLTNLAAAVATISATAGTPQSTTVNTAFASQLQATVRDSFNNPVSGVTVTLTAPGGGASGAFAGGVNTATTSAAGVASAPVITANSIAGAYTVTASVSGVASPANFSLTNLSGAASSIIAAAGTPQSATINTAFTTQLQATVKDSFSNPVSGVTVMFAAPGSGASGTFAGGVNTATTNASGVATAAVFTANGTAGSYTVTATVPGVASPANFSLTNLALIPTITGLNPASGQLGTSVTITGTNFGASQGTSTVTFNGISAGSTSWSNTSITTQVPTGATSGNVVVTVGGVPSNGATFTLTAPVINVLSPSSGGFLTPITIGGAGFGFFQGSSTVSFAGTLATPTSWNMTSITVPVPTGATSGNVVVTVGALPSNGVNFTVLPISVSVSPASPTVITNQSVGYTATVQGDTANLGVTWSLTGAGCSGSACGALGPATSNHTTSYTAPPTVPNPPTVTLTATSVADPTKSATSTITLITTPSSITATAGTPQSTTINTAFAAQLQVTVTDSGNNPVNGVTVTFTAPGSGASGTFAGGVNTATTNASGVATAAVFTANTTAGAYTVTASVAGVASPANFALTNLAGAASSIAATAGTPQSATVNTAFAVQLQATVKDSFNNPVSGVTVTFTAPNSGAGGTFAGGANTATTNASGVATAPVFTANSVAGGPYTVAASVSGVASPANFSLTNLAGAASSITATAGTPQSATVNTAFAVQLQATVKDSFNNPVSGVTVTFTAPSSAASGAFAGGANTSTTNASGIATAPVFTANTTAGGPYTVAASVTGVAFPANFSLTNLAGPAATIAATGGAPQSATINTAFPNQLQATVNDSFNNPVNGVTVTFTAPGSGASGTFAGGGNTATTNASGIATAAVFTANATAGSYTVTASASGVATPANFSLTNLSNPPPSITSLNPTSGPVGISVTITGTNFGASQGTSTVTFNGATGAPTSWSAASIVVSVPAGATTGPVVVTVSGIAANSGTFTVTPSITSLNPSSGPIGTSFTISGSNFGASQGTSQVTVGGVGVAPTSWSANSIGGVTVPNLSAGPAGVQVFVGGFGSNAAVFQVTPAITNLSPTSGPVGTSVTITGTDFGATQGSSTVTFNGVTAIPTSWGFTSIVVPVPTGATTGNVLATVAGQASNGVPFTVTAPPASIALVQHVGKDAGTTTTTTLAFNSANTAGNFIAIAIRGGLSNSQVFTVKDSNSNTYKQAKQISSSGSAVTSAIYYAENIKGGANTITVTMTVSGPLRIDILEYSGVATSNSLDATAAATTTSTSPNSGSLTTTANGDLLLAEVSTADSTAFTAGSGYTIRDFVPVEPNTKLITEDQIQSTAGTASATATLNPSSNWGAILAAFKAAGGAGGGPGTPASITATAGTPQSATVNTSFAMQLQATVRDSSNNPVSGVTVTFTAPGSGASGTFAGGVNTATTNASGVAITAVFTGNTIAGSYTMSASVSGVSIPANFSLTNLAGSPANILATGGTPQSATVNTAFAAQLQAAVKDSFNNPVSGVAVTFMAPTSGASGNFSGGLNTATTNAQGIATAPVFTANNTTGSYSVTASAPGVASIASFSLSNISGPPASITATGGTPQSATVNSAFSTALQVTVRDASNSPVSNVTVTFTAPGSGPSGTFAGGVNTVLTNSSGNATLGVFTANAVAGTYTVTASVAGVATPANFSLTNLAGPAANIAATAGTPQSAVINTAFAAQLQATVTDSLNNPVSGVTVTFTAPASGASGAFASGVNTATTNAQGVATAPVFTANATVGGPYTVSASAPGVATQANFSLTNLSAVSNITLVQHRNMDASTQTNNSLAFANNTTSGNFIAVAIRGSASSSQAFTVSDSSGNTYHQAFSVGLTASLETFAIFYAENIHGGADRIIVTQSVLGTLRFAILEYSGVATSNSLDGTATAQGNNASPNSGNLTTAANGDLLLATIISKNNGTYTVTGGYTIEESVQPAPNTKMVAEDQLQSAAGSVSAGVSLGASDIWGAGLAAFRSISGAVAPISVSVSPASTSLPAGYGTQAFTATVNNDFLNRGVNWSLSGAGCSGIACGTLSRVTTTSILYAAPANIPSPATVTVTATSIGDSTKSASVTIIVTQGVLTVVVSPKRAGVTLSSSPVQFTANVYNDAQNLGVTWQVDGNNGGTPVSGTISATGLYTPGTQPGQHTITAVSNANASVSGSALMAVTDLTGVYTNHNDNGRTGQNLKEYGLTTATVTPSTFGQLFSCPVDGYVYAQPLWVASLNFSGVTHNVVFIATEHNSVYAFDGDSPSCTQLWQTNFLSSGVTTLTSADVGSNTDIVPEIGITSTPVIDPATNTLYVVPKTRETVGTVNGQACSTAAPCYVHRLHALDLITGAEKFSGPVVISATNFSAQKHLQRPALLLANNTVYLAFGSHGDQCNYQGWLMGYNAGTLAPTFATAVSNPASGCNQGSIWQSGSGPSADASGNVYVVTANGLYDGTSNFGDTVLKFNSTGSMPPVDWFTPFNQATLAANDVDLGSATVLILPDSAGSTAHPHLAITTGKDAVVYLLDQTNMGKFNSSSNNDVQELVPVPPANTTLDDGGNYVGPAYWNGNIYLTGQNYPLMQFQIANGVIATPQFASSSNTFPPRGGAPVVSANGATGGIVWIIDYSGFQDNTPAVLDAYDANNVGTLLFSSPATGAGAAGNGVKFTAPAVANAKVYVGGQFVFTVYGLLPN